MTRTTITLLALLLGTPTFAADKAKKKPPAKTYRVDDVVRPFEGLDALKLYGARKGTVGFPNWQRLLRLEVLQVVDKGRMLVRARNAGSKDYTTIMVKCATEGIRDDQSLNSYFKAKDGGVYSYWEAATGSPLIRCVGTVRYRTALGATNTVALWEAIPRKEIAKLIQEKKDVARQKFDAARQKFLKECREWKDKDGKTLFKAKFLSKDKYRYITLERADNGKKERVYYFKLSKDDQKWVDDELKKRRTKR